MAGIATGAVAGAKAGSVFGPWGTVIGGVVGGAAGYFSGGGDKKAPATIPYQPVDLQQEQSKAIAGNAAAATSIDDLLAQSNAFQQKQASQLMDQALPGYSKFASNLMGSASKLAADPYAVPQSVVDQLTQYAAEHNISQGTGASSGFSQSNLLRSLGVNALQYGQSNMTTAMNALSVLTGTAPRTSPMSPLSFMVTPGQQIQNQQLTNQTQAGISQAGANANTAAGNYNSQNLWDNLTSSMAMLNNSGLLKSSAKSSSGVGVLSSPEQSE
jgi:hypothetical protein